MFFRKIAVLGVCMASTAAWAVLPLGQVPAAVSLQGEAGGRVDGTPWSSDELRNKVHVLIYTNVSAKDLNDEATKALKAENFPEDKFASVALINMAGSWQPNFVISKAIEAKQKEYPRTVYVKDKDKTIVKQWDLKDETNDIVVFDKDGKVAFSIDGQLKPDEVKTLIATVHEKLAELQGISDKSTLLSPPAPGPNAG